ncbi:MAG: stage II sporulation protein R [Oscillospiraceae bacterium]|nr:stage II sporulation protein R [Oscillospiraceae bacterium]
MKLKIWELSLFVALVVAVVWGLLLEQRQAGLAERLVRLHVVAHSDADVDQALKLDVRDRVRAEVEPLLVGVSCRAEAEAEILARLPWILEVAEGAVAEFGGEYAVRVRLHWERYPTRVYAGFALPAGWYSSLRVEIGEAEGQNWWCVVFPPLCLEAARGPVAFEAMGLSEGEVALIVGDSAGYSVRFRVLEVMDGVRGWWSG